MQSCACTVWDCMSERSRLAQGLHESLGGFRNLVEFPCGNGFLVYQAAADAEAGDAYVAEIPDVALADISHGGELDESQRTHEGLEVGGAHEAGGEELHDVGPFFVGGEHFGGGVGAGDRN